MKYLKQMISLTLLVASFGYQASDMLMVRSAQSFPDTMLALQVAITEQGYTVSRVQRVDIGLTKSGFATDEYRLVFFGNNEELQRLTDKYPELIPYLPWKILIFAEQDETLIVAHDPTSFSRFFTPPELTAVFETWRANLLQILEKARLANN